MPGCAVAPPRPGRGCSQQTHEGKFLDLAQRGRIALKCLVIQLAHQYARSMPIHGAPSAALAQLVHQLALQQFQHIYVGVF